MKTTTRYDSIKDYIGESRVFTAVWCKNALSNGRNTTLLIKIFLDGKEVLDHIWFVSDEFKNRGIKQDQKIRFSATIKERIRPPQSIFGDNMLDITLAEPVLLKIGKRSIR